MASPNPSAQSPTTVTSKGSGAPVGRPAGNFHNASGGNSQWEYFRNQGLTQFKFNTPDQQQAFNLAKQNLSIYAGMNYSKDMKMLIQKGIEKTFKSPKEPDDKATQAKIALYTIQLKKHDLEKEKCDKDKQKIFTLIEALCTSSAKERATRDSSFPELEKQDNVIGFLSLLESMAYQTTGSTYPHVSSLLAIQKLFKISQSPKESNDRYLTRFLNTVNAVEKQWGEVIPSHLMYTEGVKGQKYLTPADKRAATQQEFLAILYLHNSDKMRHQSLRDSIQNQHIAAKIEYPKTIDDMNTRMMNYANENSSGTHGPSSDVKTGSSFHQKKQATSPKNKNDKNDDSSVSPVEDPNLDTKTARTPVSVFSSKTKHPRSRSAKRGNP